MKARRFNSKPNHMATQCGAEKITMELKINSEKNPVVKGIIEVIRVRIDLTTQSQVRSQTLNIFTLWLKY